MPTDSCILTTKDFTILEVMRDRIPGLDDPLAPILKRKIESALVVFREDVPVNVATLSSRVTFSVDGRDADTRILSHEDMSAPTGMFLPISTPRGLALLGLAEGQEFAFTGRDGQPERIVLEKVEYQPEAARREKDALAGQPATARRKPALRLITGAYGGQARLVAAGAEGFDDPGPSAA